MLAVRIDRVGRIDRVAVGIEHRFGEAGRGGKVADGHVDVPTVSSHSRLGSIRNSGRRPDW